MAGVVAVAGPGARTPVGSHGVVFLMDFCGACRNCRQGATNQCLAKRADYGFSHDGGYGPYALLNENVFFPVPDDIDMAEATLLLDIMGTGGHSIRRAKLVHTDITSVLVTGAGPIGLGILAMVKLILGKDVPVAITDVVAYRLDLAARLGGLPVNVAKEHLAEGLKRHSLQNVDVAIDSTGKGAARREAMDALGKRGVLVCVGHGENLDLAVSKDLIATERAVLGSEYFRYNELPGNLDLFRDHRAYLSQIVTHRFGIAEVGEAFKTFIGRNTGKVVVEQ
jgi:threonine dehydrogenase-like Zn-dependent dehydrogenase